ncbi:hypothetical protein AVEN_217970-1 [Araneus ventricosus]|uniref:DDE-1 domain-containing protein n=1 Tax=Araneus ventricosus TaxID=182803 RepID=A0A4Y2DIV6_ARAVE|nr:hypothetical protein AVEN_217970-1 [Araneus ventricosus]
MKICGDRVSADAEAEKLSPEQIYNADETGLFWRYVLPAVANASEKDPTGVKDSKERIIILGCRNASRRHKTKLFIIGKLAKPRAFKNEKVFPVIYWSDKRA